MLLTKHAPRQPRRRATGAGSSPGKEAGRQGTACVRFLERVLNFGSFRLSRVVPPQSSSKGAYSHGARGAGRRSSACECIWIILKLNTRQVSIKTLFTISPYGTRIAYERIGTGLPLVLLHGGENNRHMWHEAGYIERLQNTFTLIVPDLRGHGESDSPAEPSEYTTDKMIEDILAVVDACGVDRFIIWGFSFGGKVGRYVAVHSERVSKIILIGTPFGPFISNQFRQYMADFCAHWTPILRANSVLATDALSKEDRRFMDNNNVSAMMAWGQAMLNWAVIEPGHFQCPVLWLVGSEDQVAMITVREYRQFLPDTKVKLHVIDGLDHGQVFSEIDRVFPTELAFSQV